MQLLMPSMSGPFKPIRKNVFSSLLFVDLQNLNHVTVLATVLNAVEQMLPLRFGFVPIVDLNDEAGRRLALCANYLIHNASKTKFKSFIFTIVNTLRNGKLSISQITGKAFETVAGITFEKAFEDSEKSQSYLLGLVSEAERLGISNEEGGIFANGIFLGLEQWQHEIGAVYDHSIKQISEMYLDGHLKESDSIFDFLLDRREVYKSRNKLIFGEPEYKIIQSDITWIAKNNSARVSFMLVADFSTLKGLRLALTALVDVSDARILLLHNPTNEMAGNVVSDYFHTSTDSFDVKIQRIQSALEEGTVLFKMDKDSKRSLSILKELDIEPGKSACWVNSRLVRLEASKTFDFSSLIELEMNTRISHVETLASRFSESLNISESNLADILQKICSLLVSQSLKRDSPYHPPIVRESFSLRQKLQSFKTISINQGDSVNSHLHFTAIANPMTPIGQKIISVLNVR
jgi:UDP-glucose:glycoprotein glucosyltransferase